jgi:anti-sigma-K factor RskA
MAQSDTAKNGKASLWYSKTMWQSTVLATSAEHVIDVGASCTQSTVEMKRCPEIVRALVSGRGTRNHIRVRFPNQIATHGP